MIKEKQYSLIKKNLKIILNEMIPGDSFMPSFTKAVKIDTIIKKNLNKKFIHSLKNKKINFNKKEYSDICEKILGNVILEAYFTSNSAIKSLNLRKKNYLKNTKKENMLTLIKKVKKKKFFLK